ncbi:ATP-binding protein [Spirosoma linguale]|uniref:histidine kinase n=1 Tax=Spirosoma linguale (strain ATCC 33905 / DSM 74 / LMG 10896 / Claus 1) TaxID=504472 RepID=D2QCB0_SPILD|nr:multi-sensor signal transduction histidine kinase [Spirosoma linguale DSM 74]
MIERESLEPFLAGGGEMGHLIRSLDWAKTPLGPISAWPQSLRTSVSLCLSSTFPILIAWGPETIQLYNDSYRPICGAKHPESMGQNFRICWETALPVVGDAFTRGQQGEGTYIKDQRMFLDRYGYLEEAFMTFSFAPIRDESGDVGGIFHPITETTDKMLSARRTQVLRDVAALVGQAKTNQDIYASLVEAQSGFELDLPYLLFYELEEDGKQARLVSTAGLAVDVVVPPNLNQLVVAETDWLANLPETLIIDRLDERVGPLVGGPYTEFPHTAVRLPILLSTRDQPTGFLLAGVSSRRALDQDYLNFYALLANTISTAFSNVHAYQEEQKRAEALAAIDQAKTAFFNNISHEFRTPLTLMLGPLEELLQDTALQESTYKQPIEATHRNALRLLKLVNNLLDFSRIEAGRVKASFRPVDLVGLTVDLASSFRSLIERAGLELSVDCEPMPAVVYADAEMWEKVVLNLLSNAFKYTLKGHIGVQLTAEADGVVLRVSDTGVGIPAAELPHMFERFHRVANAGGRTYEGSGIGLSLVHELVRLHGGTITVTSREGEGSTFTVRLPLGKDHLPQDQVIEGSYQNQKSQLTDTFLQEARTMLSEEMLSVDVGRMPSEAVEFDQATKILVVDDNADMRAYLTRLLAPYFTVSTAVNGADAIRQLATDLPQLILSDIMMPVMDGKELLRRVKQNPVTAPIPLIFLSARAGQEARIDGLEAGADDYLVKPFSSLELLTKIRAQINLNQTRRQGETRLRSLVEQAPVAMLLMKGSNLVIDLVNQAMLELIQREKDILGKPLVDAMPELNGQGFIDRCLTVYQTGVPDQGWSIAIPVNRNNRVETGYFNILLTPYYEGNAITGVLEVCTEITELVEVNKALATSEDRYRQLSTALDEQVQQRTAELQASIHDLQRSNDNLQQFAYVASHDLQEPLRKIQSFGDLLKNQYADNLGEGIDYLKRMQTAANRMSTLIRDLLSFSRITTRQEVTETVSLAETLSMVVLDLEVMIQETGAEMRIHPLPTVLGDRSQLIQLFQNLLSNALKFRRKSSAGVSVPPVVEVSAQLVNVSELPSTVRPTRSVAAYYRIDVTDNGIGFNEKYLDRIFQVFQRLHGKSEFQGTGIGLAICEKVVANHGGVITAQSQPGEGATFSVYLPAVSFQD